MTDIRETDTEKAGENALPTFKTNPIKAVGLLLSNVAAGMRGQPLPTTMLRQADQQRKEMELRQLDLTMRMAKQGAELFAGADLTDPEVSQKYNSFISKASRALPGFKDAMDVALEISDKAGKQMLDSAGEHVARIHGICGLDKDCIRNVMSNASLMAQFDKTADDQRLPGILFKFQKIAQAAGGDEKLKKLIADGEWTLGDLNQLPEGFAFTKSELRTIARRPEIQNNLIEYGFVPSSNLAARAKTETEEEVKSRFRAGESRPEIVKLQNERDRALRENRTDDAMDLQSRINKLKTITGLTEQDVNLQGPPSKKNIEQAREDIRTLRGDMDQIEKTLKAFEENPLAGGMLGAVLDKAGGLTGQFDTIFKTNLKDLLPGDQKAIKEARTRAKFTAAAMLTTITKEESRFSDTERRIADQALATLELTADPEQIQTALETAISIMNDSQVRLGEKLLDSAGIDLSDIDNLETVHGVFVKNGFTSKQADDLILDILEKKGIRLE